MTPVFNIPYMENLMALPGGEPTAFIVLLAVLAIAFAIVLMVVLKIFQFIVGKTKTTLDDKVSKALRAYLPSIALLTSLLIALEVVYPGVIVLGDFSEFDLYIILMLGIAGFLVSSLADAFLTWYGMELRPTGEKVREEEVYPFVRNVIKLGVLTVFLVFILQRLGFDTTAIITGLGVGGLAVALALQDTLANFFAGVHILVDRPFERRDYIKVDSGVEGTIKEIGWRTTRISTIGKDVVVVPNSKLANSTVTNYSKPMDKTGLLYTIGVDCKEDVDSVDKIITEALKRVAAKNDLLDGDTIWVRFDSFGDYTLNFKFGYLVRGYKNQWKVLKDVNRELFYTFKKKKITIPFPVRVTYRSQEGPEKK